MKRLFQTKKYKNYSRKVARKALKKRQRRISFLKKKNRSFEHKNSKERSDIKKYASYEHVPAPNPLSFTKNTELVIAFLNKLEELLLRRRKVFVELKHVSSVDYGAIAVLLSVMIKFQANRVKFDGDFPHDSGVKKQFIESGFFDHLGKEEVEREEYDITRDNQILAQARKAVDPVAALMIMITASEAIWGEKRACRGLQRVLVELMHNTNNHASTRGKGEKHWWLSVNRNKALKKVEFAFLDHGVGIFSSLREKDGFGKWHGWQEKIKKVFGMTTDEENLRLLLEGKIHLTVTGSTFRGKGLPGIKEVLDRNQISNLQIITNNVSADVANNKYNLLSNVYRGTFFYWELDSTNENQKWNIC